MDWLIDSTAADPARALGLLDDHLRRHAADPDSVPAALADLEQTLAGALEAADGRPVRAHLDWTRATPSLRLVALRTDTGGDDLMLDSAVPAGQRTAVRALDVEPLASTPVPVSRASREVFVAGPPPTAGVDLDVQSGVAAVPVAMAAVHEAHPTLGPAQVASAAGALLADAALGGNGGPLDPRAAAETIADVHRALGSDAHVVTATDDVLEIAVGHCPFGAPVDGAPSLCHITTGVAGQVAARVHGAATVVLDESLATGDAECHLQVVLRGVEDAEGETHVFPPTAADPTGVSPQFDLSVSLPREGGSVPVVRRLAGQALKAFGVCQADVDDVQLAITEACANVIDHATDTDTYDVKVELAADRCAITVVDQGGGFDASVVPPRPDDESGTGRGLMLMRALVDNVRFVNEPQAGAVVHMVKNLTYDLSHPLHRDR
ncbi:MAG: ATP-binding protein [Nocardioidaceae bacterium]